MLVCHVYKSFIDSTGLNLPDPQQPVSLSHSRSQGDDEDGPAQLQQGIARIACQRHGRCSSHDGTQHGSTNWIATCGLFDMYTLEILNMEHVKHPFAKETSSSKP